MATYDIRVDWDRDGSFEAGAENVTADVLHTGIFIDRGTDTAPALPLPLIGAATFGLTNSDYTYHPENSGSAIFGQVLPGREIRIQCTHAAVTYDLFRGATEDFQVDPNPDAQLVTVEAVGAMQRLTTGTISTEVFQGQPTGTLIGKVLDAAGWPAGRRTLDNGVTTIPYWFVHDVSPWQAILDLVAAEGPPAIVFESGAGNLVFHDRHHRILQTRSKTSQNTFRDTGTEPTYQIPQTYGRRWDAVINDVAIPVNVRTLQPLGTIWDSGNPAGGTASPYSVDLAAGESYTFVVTTEDWAINVQSPDSAQNDYTFWESPLHPTYGAPASVTLNRTSGTTFEVAVVANAGLRTAVWLNQLRGQSLPITAETTVTDEATSSQTIYELGRFSTPPPPDLTTVLEAEALATGVLNEYAEDHAQVSIRVSNGNDTRFTAALTAEINDRITIIDAGAGMNREFYVMRVGHEITAAGTKHVVVLDCQEVVAPVVSASDVLIFNDATQGKFNTGKFGL